MKQSFYSIRLLRSVLTGVVVTTAAFSFTACSDDAVEAESPIAEIQVSQENGAVIPGKYIVAFKEGENLRLNPNITYNQRIGMVREMGDEVFRTSAISKANVSRVFGKALLGVVADLSDAEAARLRKDSRVSFVEPDRVVTLGKPVSGGTTSSTGQETPYGIARVGSGNGAGKTVWVIDTGIDLNHPDLTVDVSRSMSVFSSGLYASDDDNGHGTHVAGTIAAKKNSLGVIGVAYDATVVAVKVLNEQGSGSYSGVIAGIEHVINKGTAGDVANMSLGGPVSDLLDAAVLRAAEAGIYFAIAAGNDGRDASAYSPARVNHKNVFTVSAMDSKDTFARFSNYGSPVDYCAPGVNIKSTWKNGGYNTISGTSMASPHVAGLLLLGPIINADGSVTLKSINTVLRDKDNTPDPIAIAK